MGIWELIYIRRRSSESIDYHRLKLLQIGSGRSYFLYLFFKFVFEEGFPEQSQ